jgi:O-palmitoleoyl-L-serine hydrolase
MLFPLSFLIILTLDLRCIDGSPAAFYIRPARDAASSNKWLIFFQGGAWCFNPTTCSERSRTDYGSSTRYPATITARWMEGIAGYTSLDPTVNPTLWSFNMVFARYCDGGSFSGQGEERYQVNNNHLSLSLYVIHLSLHDAVIRISRDNL